MAKKLKKRLKKKKVYIREPIPTVKKRAKKKLKKKAITHEHSPTAPPAGVIQVMTKGETLEGKYCNIASFSHTNREFIIDFLFGTQNERVHVSRVITSPQHVKAIYEALGINIKEYEKSFGEI